MTSVADICLCCHAISCNDVIINSVPPLVGEEQKHVKFNVLIIVEMWETMHYAPPSDVENLEKFTDVWCKGNALNGEQENGAG